MIAKIGGPSYSNVHEIRCVSPSIWLDVWMTRDGSGQ
jgi:hypothetical protein